ncbi:MAG: transporter substrate-binding domain-containing protein [Betaproteobacteria bacterium]|nr:transporter substrate-binding domain-containing protein [Betaproteobacteria bacterium]
MVDELAKGAIPAAAVSFATLSYYIHKHQDAGVRMTYAFDSARLSWDVAVGLRKSDQALVDEVNKVLDSLIADGTLGRIYARYGVEHRLPK